MAIHDREPYVVDRRSGGSGWLIAGVLIAALVIVGIIAMAGNNTATPVVDDGVAPGVTNEIVPPAGDTSITVNPSVPAEPAPVETAPPVETTPPVTPAEPAPMAPAEPAPVTP